MQSWTASEAKNRLGQAIDTALVEPLALTKQGRVVVVMMSAAEYNSLLATEEDALKWRALEGEASGYLSAEESEELLTRLAAA